MHVWSVHGVDLTVKKRRGGACDSGGKGPCRLKIGKQWRVGAGNGAGKDILEKKEGLDCYI